MRSDNLQKKWRPCLKCGRRIWTDRCHRFCGKCANINRRAGVQKKVFRVPNEAKADPSFMAVVILGETFRI